MRKSFLGLIILLLASAAHADRITEMNEVDRCTYVAKLEVIALYFFEQGKPREEVVIHWHGDETENEIAFVNKTVDNAYAWLTAWKESSNAMLPAQSFGDMIFQACMEGKLL
jgi:hypothetical protein